MRFRTPIIARESRARAAWYDPDVLDSIAAWFETVVPEASVTVGSPRDVQLKDLRSGDVFAANVVTNENTLLAVAGTVISDLLIEKLCNFDQLVGLRRPFLVLLHV